MIAEKRKYIHDIKNKEVAKEIFKLLEIFSEGFINNEMEIVICHPVNPVDVYEGEEPYYKAFHGKGRNVYCNVYFCINSCSDKKDVQAKVLEWWSRDAYKTQFAGSKVTEIIQDYIRRGINEYLKTCFSRDDMETIYCHLGNSINHALTMKFIESKFNMEVLK